MLNALRKQARPLARIGCAAIGTVYVLIGGVALIALTGHLIEYADQNRIGLLLKGMPGGVVLLWAMALGAAAYVVWRVIEALSDPYEAGGGWAGTAERVGIALSGLAYGLFAYSAARVALTSGSVARDAPEQQQQHVIAGVLHWPAGTWIVMGAGALVVLSGLLQFWFVLRGSYTKEIRMTPQTKAAERIIRVLGSYGYAARGVILCVLGYFFIRGALDSNAAVVGDTDTAFDFIGGGLIGDSAFAIVAVGTVAYGLFMYANAWLYRFESEPGRPRMSRGGR